MLNLLLAIQTELKTIPGIRPHDVFLSPGKNFVWPGAGWPCIGIKDGGVDRSELSGGVTELGLPVEIYIYDMMGDTDRAIKSVFAIRKKAHDLLKENDLNGYVKDVEPGKESPVELLFRKDGMVLRKTLFYTYEREEE